MYADIYLVGGFNPSEKYESVGMIIPNIWKNKKNVPNHQPDDDQQWDFWDHPFCKPKCGILHAIATENS